MGRYRVGGWSERGFIRRGNPRASGSRHWYVYAMRILVTSTSGTGHLHPIVPLAQELLSAGHEIAWATAADACGAVERFGFRAFPVGISHTERTAMFLATRLTELFSLPPRAQRAFGLPIMFGEIAAPAMYDDLVSVFDHYRPQLVIHEVCELAAAPIATKREIPHVSIGFGVAFSDELLEAVLLAVGPTWERQKLTPTAPDFHGQLLLHPFPRSMDTPRADGPSGEMRPLSYDGAASMAEPEWADRFGKERPGVYVTFGTEMGAFAPWSAVLEAVSELEVDVVATIGSQLDPTTLGSIPENTRVERYVPQSFLIERASVVVSHAGAGTVIAAASNGKPHLSIPISADNWENADLLSRHNVGITIEADERDASSVARAITGLLNDRAVSAAASIIKREFSAMQHPGALVTRLQQLTC